MKPAAPNSRQWRITARYFLVAGNDDDRGRGTLGAQEQQSRETPNSRHRQVKQHEIRLRRSFERRGHAVEIMGDGDVGVRRGGQHGLSQTSDHSG